MSFKELTLWSAAAVICIIIAIIMGEEIKEARMNAYTSGLQCGLEIGIRENIKHGVMDKNGKWLPGFNLVTKKGAKK